MPKSLPFWLVAALLSGVGFFSFMHFDLHQLIPALRCESFGCVGLGIIFVAMGVVILPLGAALLAVVARRGTKAALCTFGAVLLANMLAFGLQWLFVQARIAHDVANAEQAEKMLRDRPPMTPTAPPLSNP